MVKEVGELELGEGPPKGKFREPGENENDSIRVFEPQKEALPALI